MQSRIAHERKSEIVAVWRMSGVAFHKLLFGRERNIAQAAQRDGLLDARGVEFALVKWVGRQALLHQVAKSPILPLRQLLTRKRLQLAIVECFFGPASSRVACSAACFLHSVS